MRGSASPTGAAARTTLVVVGLVVASMGALTAETRTACLPGAVEAAAAAVRDVFGPASAVVLDDVACANAPQASAADVAVPEPGSRTDGPVRFVLYAAGASGRSRVGRLTATVAVVTPHVRTVTAVDARTNLDGVVQAVDGPVGRVPFDTLPTLEEVTAARTRRPLAQGTVVLTATLDRPALVQSGADVVTIARVDGVEVRGRAVAAQDGHRGDVVVIVNPDSRKRLRGRVVGDALVEVLHVS